MSSVYLFQYDLTNGAATQLAPMLIGRHLDGVWHTSIVLYGTEYYFDGGVGIVSDALPYYDCTSNSSVPPYNTRSRFGAPKYRVLLGHTTIPKDVFASDLVRFKNKNNATLINSNFPAEANRYSVEGGFGPDCYNLLNNNCNHFTYAAYDFIFNNAAMARSYKSTKLREYPPDVKNMISELLSTGIGAMLRPTLESMTHSNASGAGGGGNFSMGDAYNGSTNKTPAAATGSSSKWVCKGLLSKKKALSEEERESLDLAAVMLESNEHLYATDTANNDELDGLTRTVNCIELLMSVYEKIILNPMNVKFRTLAVDSKAYREKVEAFEEFGVSEILQLSGFQLLNASEVGKKPSDEEGKKWVLRDENGNKDLLSFFYSFLEELKEKIELNSAIEQSKDTK